MWYEKQPQDLTVGDLEGMTIEEIEVPDYDYFFRKAREGAESIFAKE